MTDRTVGKFPVVFLSLKNVDGLTFDEAKYQLIELIGMEAERFQFLVESRLWIIQRFWLTDQRLLAISGA